MQVRQAIQGEIPQIPKAKEAAEGGSKTEVEEKPQEYEDPHLKVDRGRKTSLTPLSFKLFSGSST